MDQMIVGTSSYFGNKFEIRTYSFAIFSGELKQKHGRKQTLLMLQN